MKLNLEGVAGGGCGMSSLPSPETLMTNHGGGRTENGGILGTVGATNFMRIMEEDCNSSGSSSIGKNSDDDDDDDREGEAESRYRYDHHSNNNKNNNKNNDNNKISNGCLDDAIQALEEALPIR